MGKSVKSALSRAKSNPIGTIGGALIGGPVGAAIGSQLKIGAIDKLTGRLQGDVLDPLRGKYGVAEDYVVNEAGYQDSAPQAAFTEALRMQSMGHGGPTVAQQQLQQATNRNIGQLAGRAAGARGPNQALALREGLRAQGTSNQEAAAQSGLLRAQEMQTAQQAYAADLARQQASKQELEKLKAGIRGQTQQLQTSANLNQQQGQKGLIQNVATALLSDKNEKKNIKKADLNDLVKKIKAVSFEYKQPNGESYQNGTVDGFLAQDLEESKLGKEMIMQDAKGKKMVDLKKAVPVTMAAVSEIMKRLNKLEKKA